LKILGRSREHFCHEKFLDASAILFDGLANGLDTRPSLSDFRLAIISWDPL
jgi:hypothetical protein